MPHTLESPAGHALGGTCTAGMPGPAVEFLRRLRGLPLYAWAGAARAVEAIREQGDTDDDARTTAAAHAALRDTVESVPGLAIHLRRCVDNLVEIAETCLDGADVTRMQRAALCAALAVATQDQLGESLFRRLYAPFEPLIPAGDLRAPDLTAT